MGAKLAGTRPGGTAVKMTEGDIYSTVISLISHWVSVLSHINTQKKKMIFMELNNLAVKVAHQTAAAGPALWLCEERDDQRVNCLQLSAAPPNPAPQHSSSKPHGQKPPGGVSGGTGCLLESLVPWGGRARCGLGAFTSQEKG